LATILWPASLTVYPRNSYHHEQPKTIQPGWWMHVYSKYTLPFPGTAHYRHKARPAQRGAVQCDGSCSRQLWLTYHQSYTVVGLCDMFFFKSKACLQVTGKCTAVRAKHFSSKAKRKRKTERNIILLKSQLPWFLSTAVPSLSHLRCTSFCCHELPPLPEGNSNRYLSHQIWIHSAELMWDGIFQVCHQAKRGHSHDNRLSSCQIFSLLQNPRDSQVSGCKNQYSTTTYSTLSYLSHKDQSFWFQLVQKCRQRIIPNAVVVNLYAKCQRAFQDIW